MPARATRLLHTTISHTDALIWLPRPRLLVVDDSQLNLDVARKVLELEGAEVVTLHQRRGSVEGAARERSTVRRRRAGRADAGMDGLALARAVRGLSGCGSLPLVALSAGVLQQERDLALRANMSDFLPKPLEPRRLVACLRRHVERGRGTPVPVLQRNGPVVVTELPAALEIEGIDDHRIALPLPLRRDRALLLSLLRHLVGDLDMLSAKSTDLMPALLHRLRGSAQVVGAMALEEAAFQFEVALRQQDDHAVATARQAFGQRAAALAFASRCALQVQDERLAQRREQERAKAGHASSVPPLDASELAALRELLDAQSTWATQRVEDLAEPLLRQLGPDRLARLRGALAEFDFRSALHVLGDIGDPLEQAVRVARDAVSVDLVRVVRRTEAPRQLGAIRLPQRRT